MPRYKDFDILIQKNPVTQDVGLKFDANAVKQSVKNLIFMSYYDKPRNPGLAGNIRNLLFELVTPITAINIEQAVRDVIEQYEPRADLIDVRVATTQGGHGYNITIEYNILNETEPQNIDLLLERIR